MAVDAILAQTSGLDGLLTGDARWILWLLLAGIVCLWLVIRRTQKRSYRSAMSARERERQLRAQDPDLAGNQPRDEDGPGDGA